MEPALIGKTFLAIVAYIFVAPKAAKAAMLDAKLDPEPGEDETRVLVVQDEELKTKERRQRLDRFLYRRWLRAANYRIRAGPGAGVLTPSDGGPGMAGLAPDMTGRGRRGSPDDEVGRMLDLPSIWIGYDDKRRLDGIESIEFLLSLPDRYGEKCSFVMFSFNYDVTMLLKGLRQGRSKNWHYDRLWEICKRQDKDTKKVRNNTIHIGNYSVSYIKSKVLVIHKLDTEPDENGHYPVLKRATIYDVFGFYQASFVQVVSSLVPLGLATEEEVERMRRNKARRSDFGSEEWPLERIKAYTTEELRKLSAAVTVLRKAAAEWY